MVQINFARREISCKIVFYGPGMSGKTTNLQVIHQKAPKESKGDLIAIATEGDRTLFFDFLPLDLGQVKGMNTKFQLYTVPGQVYYASTRKLVLQGADGVVFVADSQKKKLDENIEALKDLETSLKEYGIDMKSFPLVIQWNKRDLPDAAEIPWLDEHINWTKAVTTEAVAARGDGVMQTLKVAAKLVLDHINSKGNEISGSSPAAAATPAAPKKEEVLVALVNGGKVVRNYFVNYCQTQYRLTAPGEVEDFKRFSREEELGQLNGLINQMLLMQEAKKNAMVIDKKAIEAQVVSFARKFGSMEKFNQWLAARHLTMDAVKNEAVKNIVITMMLKSKYGDVAAGLAVAPAEATAYYDSHQQAFPGGPEKNQERIVQILKNKKKKKMLDDLFADLRKDAKIEIFEDKL